MGPFGIDVWIYDPEALTWGIIKPIIVLGNFISGIFLVQNDHYWAWIYISISITVVTVDWILFVFTCVHYD